MGYAHLKGSLVAAGAVLGVTSTSLWLDWAQQGDLTFSVLGCRDCPSFIEGSWSWECFAQYYCDTLSVVQQCEGYEHAYLAFSSLMYFEVLALLFNVLLIEKLLLANMKRDFGPVGLFYVYSACVFFMQLAGVGLWLLSVQPSFEDCPVPNEGDSPVFCIKSGGILGSVSVLCSLFMSVYVAVVVWRRDIRNDALVILENGKCLCARTHHMMFIVLLGMGCGAGLIVYGILNNDWVEGNSKRAEFVGGLTHCKDCSENYSWAGYGCLAAFQCEDSETCELYENLNRGSEFFLLLQIVSALNLVLLIQAVAASLGRRGYGIPCLNYVSAI